MAYLAAALMNLAVVGLAAFAVWWTGSLWGFVALIFLFAVNPRSSCVHTCPKCKHVFKDNDDADED